MKNFFLLAVTLSLYSCCHDDDCVDIELGHYEINDSLDYWIPFQGGESVVFINSNDFEGVFSSSILNKEEKTLQKNFIGENCDNSLCFSYYTVIEKIMSFTSTDVGLEITYSLRKNINYSNTNVDDWDKSTDILMLSVNNHSLPIPIDSTNKTEFEAQIVKLDSLVLGSQVYYDVIHSSVMEDTDQTILKGMYYTKNDGIIGFYLTNEELWTRY